MLYKEITVGEKELKLRLDIKNCCALEEKLGCNPMQKLISMQSGELPEMTFLAEVLHYSLRKYQHEYTLEKTYELMDEMMENGTTLMEMIPLLMDIFKVSGFFKEETKKTAK